MNRTGFCSHRRCWVRCIRTFAFVSGVLPSVWSPQAAAQKMEAVVASEVYARVELTFQSAVQYEHPQAGVELRCTFTGPGGRSITISGYWERDRIYKVRFSPPEAGTWTWRSECSDPLNFGLTARTGSILAIPAHGPSVFRSKGWPRVSKDGRYLTYADGDPWFYLADTAWEVVCRGRMPDIEAFISDRRSKRYNALQFCVTSHFSNGTYGIHNQSGETTFLNDDRSLPNAGYFRILDSIVTMLNDSDMVAVITPLWAYFAEPNRDDPRFQASFVSKDEAREWARYIGARYAGDNVIWIVAGDKTYATEEQREYWTAFADELRRSSGGMHLMTMHCAGAAASFDFFDNSTPWLDFHMYQSCHAAENYGSWELALEGYDLRPPKPVLDGESTFEDLYENFWIEQDSSVLFRFTDSHVRRPRYQSLLSGALVGVTYGANGIYQWFTPAFEDNHFPRNYVWNAWRYPGSANMTVIRAIAESLRWYDFVPAPQTWRPRERSAFIPTARTPEMELSYFPVGAAVSDYEYTAPVYAYHAWLNPRTGAIGTLLTKSQFEAAGKPDTLDWLLLSSDDIPVFQRFPADTSTWCNGAHKDNYGYWNTPNPFREATTLHIERSDAGNVRIDLYTLLGRHVETIFNGILQKGHQLISLPATALLRGLYFCVFTDSGGARAIPLIKY